MNIKITKQQKLDHIVSITAGLLASGHFTYVRQDSKGAEVRTETIENAETIWNNLKKANDVEISDATPEASTAQQPGGTLKTEARKGK